MNRQTIKRILFVLVLVASFGFLGHRVVKNLDTIREYPWHVDPRLVGLSLVMHVGVLVFGTFVWSRILRRFAGPAVPVRTLLRIWSTATMGRYVPGVIWQFLLGARLAEKYSVSPLRLFVSMAMHMGVALTGAAVVALTMAIVDGLVSVAWLPLGVALAAVAVHPALIARICRLLGRLTRRDVPAYEATWPNGLALLGASIASWLVYGTALWVLLHGLVGDGHGPSLPRAIGIHAFVFVAGYGAFFVPAGIGVRESALALLLGPDFSDGVAVALAATSRIWTIGAELGVLLLSLVLTPPRASAAPEE